MLKFAISTVAVLAALSAASAGAQAAVYTQSLSFSGASALFDLPNPHEFDFTPFQTTGTIQSVVLSWGGQISPGGQVYYVNPGIGIDSSVTLTPYAQLSIGNSRGLVATGTPLTLPLVVPGNYASLPIEQELSTTLTLPTTTLGNYLSSPFVTLDAGSRVTPNGNAAIDNIFDLSFEAGVATLTVTYDPAAVPEPASFAVLGAGLVAVAIRRRFAAFSYFRLRTFDAALGGVILSGSEMLDVRPCASLAGADRCLEPFFPRSRELPRKDDPSVISGIMYVIRNGLR